MYWLLIEGVRRNVDLNLGCPQEHAREGHYGAYLLGQTDWPVIEQLGTSLPPFSPPPLNPNPQTVSQLSTSLPLPISTKLRLCSPSTLTPKLGKRIAAHGASWITLHARHVNARKRRAGPADLGVVRELKVGL